MPVISCLFNAMSAGKKWKAPAVWRVWILFICPKRNKKNSEAELTKAGMFSIRQNQDFSSFGSRNIFTVFISNF